ncbi:MULTISPECIES: conjugal transfer protein TraF [Halomonas]|uniref:conjugal transfer protein TraF n=1 Tax=Halomonas TaxID=2745 RepID=UPI003CFADA95
MGIFSKRPLLLAVALSFGTASMAAHANIERDPRGSFWQNQSDGWFFYKDPPEPVEEVIEEPEPEPLEGVTVTEPPEPPPAPEPEGPPPPEPLSAEWFRENIPKYRDAAWNDPTVENVQAFFYLQRYMMDRSEQFSDAAQLATMGHPILDEANRRPTAGAGSRQLDRIAANNRTTILDKLAERVGIFYFYDSECQECAEITNVVKMLERTFAIIPISLDGKDLPGNPFPDFRPDDGHAEQVGMERAPALFLAEPSGEFAAFAHGPISLNDARERIVLAALRVGWISREEFNQTRPVRNLDQDLSDMIDPAEFMPSGDDNNFIPPAELLERFNQSGGYR